MSDSLPPSYSFHGSNSSQSKDSGSGGRTYHVPNYATRSDNKSFSGSNPKTEDGNSYANERTKLIDVSFDEDKGMKKITLAMFAVLVIFAAILTFVLLGSSHSKANVLEWQRYRDDWIREQYELNKYQKLLQESTYRRREDIEREDFHEHGISKESREESARQKEDRQLVKNKQHEQTFQWSEPRGSEHCLAYETREYTARLWNVPFFSDWTKACKNTMVNIRGVTLKEPAYCENQWPFGGMIGHWIVNFGEAGCMPNWGSFSDEGCTATGSQLRRFQARLWNIHSGDDWMKMCTTTPATIQGVYLNAPKFCNDLGSIWGIYGVWELEDSDC